MDRVLAAFRFDMANGLRIGKVAGQSISTPKEKTTVLFRGGARLAFRNDFPDRFDQLGAEVAGQ